MVLTLLMMEGAPRYRPRGTLLTHDGRAPVPRSAARYCPSGSSGAVNSGPLWRVTIPILCDTPNLPSMLWMVVEPTVWDVPSLPLKLCTVVLPTVCDTAMCRQCCGRWSSRRV